MRTPTCASSTCGRATTPPRKATRKPRPTCSSGSRLAGQRWLVFSIDSDFCFYPEEQAELVKHLEDAKVDVMHIIVHSDKGHDSFLLEPDLYTPHVSWLLGK